jgi:hypothetical protein
VFLAADRKIKIERAEKNIWTQEQGSNDKMEKLHNEGLHNLHSLLNRPFMMLVEPRKMRWRGILKHEE